MHLDNFMSRLNVIPYHALTFFVSKLDNAVAQTRTCRGEAPPSAIADRSVA